MDLIELYKNILDFASMECDDEGYVFKRYKDELEPALDNGKRIVLPTPNHLKNPEDKLIFHPLNENILRGESESVRLLRRSINARLNVSCFIIMKSLLMLAASHEQHSQLTPDQTELLIKLKDVDKTTVVNFVNIGVKGMVKNPDRNFVNIYLKRGGSLDGKRYSRVGICNFHFYQELLKPAVDNTIYDVKIRIKDREMYKQVFEYVFPKLKDNGNYNHGSDCSVAPYLDALLKTSLNIVSIYTDIISLFSKYIEDDSMLDYNSDWVEEADNFDKWIPSIRKIPMQDSSNITESIAASHPAPTPTVQMQQPGFLNPPAPQTPQVRRTANGIDFASLMAAETMRPMQNMYPVGPMVPMNPMMGTMPNMGPNRMPSWAMPQYPQPTMGPGYPMQGPGMMPQPMMMQTQFNVKPI